MAPYRVYLIGTTLLFLSQVAYSFILLTANMEDVKKIARKFVSDSLADKIAEFVARASEQMVTNVSEENDKNANVIQNLSHENEDLQNMGRQRYEKATRNTKDDSEPTTKHVRYEKVYNTPNNRIDIHSNPGQMINWGKEANDIAYENTYPKEAEPQNNPLPDHEYSKHDYEQSNNEQIKGEYEQPKQNKKRIKYNKQKATLEPSNHDYEQQKLDYELPKPKPDSEQQIPDYEQPKIDYEQQNPDNDQSKLDFEQPLIDYEQPKAKHNNIQPKINYEHPKIKRPKLHHEWKKLNDPRERDPPNDEEEIYEDKQSKLEDEPRLVYQNMKTAYENTNTRYEQQKTEKKPRKLKKRMRPRQKMSLKEQQRPDEADNTPKRETPFKPAVHSTIMYEKGLRTGNQHKKPSHRGYKLASYDFQEPISSNTITSNQSSITSLKGFNIPIFPLTTKKERLEFDQYDNPNYPKAEFIATSGPVALPKVPLVKPWWEKEMVLMK